MAGRDGTNCNKQSRKAKARRRRVAILGGAAAAFAAAAAMATGSAVTAAPAKADIDALLDPIIQPLMASLSDAIAGFDPAAAADLTSWTDSLLASLNSLDIATALPSAAEPAAAAASASPAASGPYDIPITMQEVTEPTIQATVAGSSPQTLLVDTGSSGLVIPWENVGLFQLLSLGFPTGISESGYSGGVDYLYLTYNDATVDYGTGAGALDATNTPIDVEFLSWPTSLTSPSSFEAFLSDNQVTGILGIGENTGGPTTSPLENYGGVLVDIPDGKMIVDSSNPLSAYDALSGAPIPVNSLTETVTNGSTVIGSGAVSDDLDSGGVYGTIPSTIASTLAPGDKISVYDGSTLLYQYTVGTDSLGTSTAPTVVTGTAGTNSIDSGVEPYLMHPIYIDYANDTLYFDNLSS
jgi:hypothetical protein